MAAQRQASSASQTPHLSPAELSYLYTSLGLPGTPIRPDGRSPTQFRPLTAETDILPGTNGSARVGFADGTQAIRMSVEEYAETLQNDGDESSSTGGAVGAGGHGSWVQMSIEIPGFRADDALPVFLAEMMREPLIESVSAGEMAGGLKGRLVINRRWHWRLHLVVLLLSQPLSYPLPLLSLTTHLALLSTKLPKLKSKGEEDPFFDDDWNAAEYLYPRLTAQSHHRSIPGPASPLHKVRPPVTLLVISVAENVIFDPSREEIAVADAVLAVSVAYDSNSDRLKLLSIRTVDPPSRLTQPGVPTSENATTLGAGGAGVAEESVVVNPSTGEEEVPGVWRPRRGGVKRATIARIVKMVLEKGGVGEEVLEGLEGVQVG
ncbi:3' exoribonuclease family protein [Aspergillus rambellii]|uniref:Ribosomal RNA-processing protein 42 n=1 Tax=Aspergillus rambellii TaxID=308745 RepID=A0A0F8WPP8_9EURO|nr:3' exoribonuclease family protein [Aspergillus rambellii]